MADFVLYAVPPGTASLVPLPVVGLAPSDALDGDVRTPLFVSDDLAPDGAPAGEFYRVEGRDVLRFRAVGDFYVDDASIAVHAPGAAPMQVLLHAAGPALAFWYERSGRPVLHGAALAHRGRAFALLGHPGAGKSTLALALLQAGCTLLGDDVAPLLEADGRVLTAASLAQLRVNADAARHLLGDVDNLPRLFPEHDKRMLWLPQGAPGGFAADVLLLAAIYVLERETSSRSEHAVQVEPLGGQAALMALVKYSFVPRVVEALGWQAARLQALGRVVDATPVKRLRYAGGFARLPSVVAGLLADIAQG